MPECPKHLDAEAKAEWQRLAPKLFACGLLTEIDDDALAAYCEVRSTWIRAKRHLAENGMTVYGLGGIQKASPFVAIANASWRQMLSIMCEFGMTPSSRSRISAEPPPATSDPFDDLLSGA